MTAPPLSREMPCGACNHPGHLFACERCGCTAPQPGLPDPRKADR